MDTSRYRISRNENLNADVAALIASLDSAEATGDQAEMAQAVDAICVRFDIPRQNTCVGGDDIDGILRCAQVLERAKSPYPIDKCVHILLDAAYSQIILGSNSAVTNLVEKAIEWTTSGDGPDTLRRSLNIHAALLASSGQYLAGIDCALASARVAVRMGMRTGLIGALCNAAVQFVHLGLCAEALEFLQYLYRTCTETERALGIHRTIATNVCATASALGNYDTCILFGDACLCELENLTDTHSEYMCMICNVSMLRAEIEIGDKTRAAARILRINSTPNTNLSNPRSTLLCELANGAYKSFIGEHATALEQLLALLERTRELPTIYTDNLELLTEAYQRAGDHANALRYLSMRIEARGKWQADGIGHSLQRVRQRWITKSPGHADAAALIESIRLAKTTPQNRTPERASGVPSSAPEEFQSVFENLAVAAELGEDRTGHHTFRVGKLSQLLLAEIGGDPAACSKLECAARLHDIGKLGLPGNLLPHAGKLSESETRAMHEHCEIGAQLLAQANHACFALAATVALSHHERWDGSGYPNGLKGNAIPQAARIVAIAEAFDVLTQGREYQQALSVEAALARVVAASGIHFEPRLVKTFVPLMQRLSLQHGAALHEFLSQAGDQSSFLEARASMKALLVEI